MSLMPPCRCTASETFSGQPNPACPRHGSGEASGEILDLNSDETLRIRATMPLLLTALNYLEKAEKARRTKKSDPGYYQAVLEAAVSIHFAIDALNGALALVSSLAWVSSDKLEEIRLRLRPVLNLSEGIHGLLPYETMPDGEEDPPLVKAFWQVFDCLVPPQIEKLRDLVRA